jgi:hypothetical protein
MLIGVKQEHIEKGRGISAGFCPKALAINEATGKAGDCSVGPFDAFVCGKLIDLPQEARAFVAAFDALYSCSPFSFELPIK